MDEIEKKSDLKLVLNGGSRQMDGATIPVKWFFSEELAKKEPTHILLIDLAKGEEENNNSGRRYVAKVEEVVAFIQLFRSGHHTMLALAFNNELTAYRYLEKNEYGLYAKDVIPKVVEVGASWENSLAVTYVEFEVPKELFAKKPESKLGKLWWNYLFWPKRPKARDECQVRKLAWFYSLPKLPLFILGNLFYTLYTLTAISVVFFFGLWPISFKETIRRIVDPVQNAWNLNVLANGSDTEFLKIYKDGWDTGKKMWFSTFFLLLFFAILGTAIYLVPLAKTDVLSLFLIIILTCIGLPILINFNIKRFFDDSDLISFVIALIMIVLTSLYAYIFGEPVTDVDSSYYFIPSVFIFMAILLIILGFLDKIEKFMKNITKKMRVKHKGGLSYEEYLLKNFTLPEKKVTLKNLPQTFKMNQTKRSLRIHFWATKSKICRPFES